MSSKELNAVLTAIEVMEDVANTTQDIDSFKKLTVGYNKIKVILNFGEEDAK